MIQAVSETVAKRLVTLADAIGLMDAAFAALDRGESVLFPFVAGHGFDPGTRFGAKLGYDGPRRLPGLKVGSYWPGNRARGIGNHGSTTLLLDDETGLLRAVIAATHLTALRTAASDALAVKHLARPDASGGGRRGRPPGLLGCTRHRGGPAAGADPRVRTTPRRLGGFG